MLFAPDAAAGLRFTAQFRFGAEAYCAAVADSAFTVERGEADAPDLTFEGTPEGVAAFVYGGVPPAGLAAAGMLRVEGGVDLVARFPTLFRLPPKAGAG